MGRAMSSRAYPPLPPLAEPEPSVNGVHRVRLEDGSPAWLKLRRDQPAAFLEAEADGLERLRSAGGMRLPLLLGLEDHRLLLGDLGIGEPKPDFAAQAGRGLAMQHRWSERWFGLPRDGWCGESPQDNSPDADGLRFFAECRLLPQARRALQTGHLDAAGMEGVERLCSRLPGLVPVQPAVLLHGDLWIGNLHCCADGSPALIDTGAVHYGWAEAELSMLVLFGEPPPRLFQAYAEQATLHADWRERAPVYNLYHLLNHLNLFGGGYLGAVQSVLRRFAGKP